MNLKLILAKKVILAICIIKDLYEWLTLWSDRTSADRTVRDLSASHFVQIFRRIVSWVLDPDFSSIFVQICLSRFCSQSRFCLDFEKNVCGLSVRPEKDETELFGLSLSLSADILVKFEEAGRI